MLVEHPTGEIPTGRTGDAAIPGRLDFIWLELTGKCNLRCVHCYADSGPELPLHDAMSPQAWADMLEQAAFLGCRSVQFIGGEPTLHPALPMLIGRARQLGFAGVEVYTNGTFFKPRVREAFLKHRVDLAFSVYAAGPEMHDRVTGQAGSFERTRNWIEWSLAQGLRVRASIIETDANPGQIEVTRAMLAEMGVKRIGADRVRGVGRGLDAKPVGAQLEQLCGACVRKRLAVTPSGEIYPCVFSRFWPVGRAAEGLEAAVEGMELAAFRKAMAEVRPDRLRPHDAGAGPVVRTEGGEPEKCAPEMCMPAVPCRPDQPPQCSPDLGGCMPDEPECLPHNCMPTLNPCAPQCAPSDLPEPCAPGRGEDEEAARPFRAQQEEPCAPEICMPAVPCRPDQPPDCSPDMVCMPQDPECLPHNCMPTLNPCGPECAPSNLPEPEPPDRPEEPEDRCRPVIEGPCSPIDTPPCGPSENLDPNRPY